MTLPLDSQKPTPFRPRPPESLEELARSQGVRPVEDLDALARLWPADDDPDELDAFLHRQRASRRSVVPETPALVVGRGEPLGAEASSGARLLHGEVRSDSI